MKRLDVKTLYRLGVCAILCALIAFFVSLHVPADHFVVWLMVSVVFVVQAIVYWSIGIARSAHRHGPVRGRFCRACGYDLFGTFAAGRRQCPECGIDAFESFE